MGMAASQARLLSITSRLADNELRAQVINNSKMRLASESSKVSEEYVSALNSATMMMSNYDVDGNSQYQQLTFNSLTAYSSHNNQYGLIDANGRLLVNEDDAVKFRNAEGDLDKFLNLNGLYYTSNYFTPETLGGDTIKIMGINGADESEFEIGTYSLEQLKTMYEGGEYDGISYNGYNKDLQSYEYSQYSDLYNQYTIMKDYLSTSLEVALNKRLFGEVYNSAKSVIMEDNKNIQDYYNAIKNLWENIEVPDGGENPSIYVNNDYLNSMKDIYTHIGDQDKVHISWIEVFGIYNAMYTYNTKINAPEDGSINIGERISNDENGNEITTYDISIDSSGKITLGGNVSNVKYNDISYQNGGTIDDYDPNNLEKLEYTYSENSKDTNYLYNNWQRGDSILTADCIYNLTEQEVRIFAKDFLSKYENCASFVNYMALADEQDQANFAKARDALIQFIFCNGSPSEGQSFDDFWTEQGLDPADLENIRDNFQMLNDPGWIIANYKGETSDNFTNIENIFILDSLFNIYGEPAMGWIDINNPKENADAKVQWYTNLFNRMTEGHRVLEDGLASSNEWIQFALESGLVTMEQVDTNNKWVSMTHANCSDITEVMDDVMIARAEAEYNKAMNNIENKDKRFDMELKNIDTEHNALQTEYDSIKNVIGKNIERSFKIYS